MRKILTFLLLMNCFWAVAQHKCATTEKMQEALNHEDAYKASIADLTELQRQFEAGEIANNTRDDGSIYTIPVVVHVVYYDEVNNISMAQIHSQIDVLNRDFNLRNADQSEIPAVFSEAKASVGFNFVLADKDPNGNFTTGVTRTKTTVQDIGDTEFYYKSSAGGIDPWPQPHYLNVWVCDIGGLVLGYSFLPATKKSKRDGIVMAPRAFGTMGTAVSPYNLGRTMVHETGHYFGLQHLWGSESGDCNHTDYMSDTPNQFGPNNGCKTFPTYSCPNEATGDMFMNYMDYATDGCMYLFTERQASFMRLVINTSRVSLQHSTAVTSVQEIEVENKAVLYPNPASDLVHLEFLNQISDQVSLIDVRGVLIKTWQPKSKLEAIDMSDLDAGVYFLKTSSETLRLVIQ